MAAEEKHAEMLTGTKKMWNSFAMGYSERLAPQLLLAGQQLLVNLKCQKGENVLEIGCGDGRLAEIINNRHGESITYSGIDLSETFVEIASERNPTLNLKVGNAQTLEGFEDQSMHKCISSLVVMIVPNAQAALNSAYRVLKPGGVAAFSFWGRKAEASFWTSFYQAVAKSGFESSGGVKKRSNFHLGDNNGEKIKEFAREAGFSRVLFWYAPIAFPISSGEEYLQFFNGAGSPALSMCKTEEQKTALFNNIKECGAAHLAKGEPLLFDVGYLVCFKD